MQAVQYQLDSNALRGLGGLLPGQKTKISPLRSPSESRLTDDQVGKLHKSGILDSNGRISASCLPALETLASAQTLSNLLFFDGSKIIEYTCFFSPDGEKTVALTDTDEGLFLEEPAQIDGFIKFLKELTGESSVCNMEYDNEFNAQEAYLLATLIDLHRQSIMRSFVEKSNTIMVDFSVPMILDEIAAAKDNSQWLAPIVKHMLNMSSPPSEANLLNSLDTLVASKQITRTGEHIRLGEKAELLANRFLVINNIVRLSSIREIEDGDPLLVGLNCLQSGVYDLLMLNQTGLKIEFTTISAANLLAYVSTFFSDMNIVNLLFKEISEIAEAASTQQGAICPVCGTRGRSGAKFCINCGSRLVQ